MKKPSADSYSDQEIQRRFEAALRGARLAQARPMKEIPRKRPKRRGKRGKSTAKRG
jgi:hypothetical protein